MEAPHTTAVIQGYLDELAGLRGDAPAEPVVRALLAKSAGRLQLLCSAMLHRAYPRLMRPPLNVRSEEMLGAVVERLIKAMRQARPGNVRQFFYIASQHLRWELNDLARRLDEESRAVSLHEESVWAPESSGSVLSPNALRMLAAIEHLPNEEREAFDLVRIQGISHSEAAAILDVSTKTIQRRLNRSLVLLAKSLGDLRPADKASDEGNSGSSGNVRRTTH